MADNEHTNRAEEDRCLDEVRGLINKGKNSGSDVAALIIEPISGLNNQMATPYYYKKLRQIAKENNITFIVDETKTGVGITSKMWAHEHWFLRDHPDIVTFGGKAGISGFFATNDYRFNDLGISYE